ncbi:hypothetical protein CFP56_004493 [Quercus suber]|uniref:Uncharacterized protein n=1 Tax=Quercus suber TaxID=58331 RepID=A0AAW0LCS2_QUESU
MDQNRGPLPILIQF